MRRPNVLVVCADDLGWGDLSCYGAEYETPNIDRLAAGGVRLTDWHANAPICSPTRASILTGKYPHRAGVPGNAPQGRPETNPDPGLSPDQATLPSTLSAAGYRTGAFGKWHLGMTDRDDPLAHGFDESFGFRSGCVDYYSHVMYWAQSQGVDPYHDLWNGREEVHHDGAYLTDLITERATAFIEGDARPTRSDAAEGPGDGDGDGGDGGGDGDGGDGGGETSAGDGEPFFAYVAYSAPHYPLQTPPEYRQRFPDLSGDRRTHAAMVATLDDAVGDLLDALARADVAEETLVVFTGDHGPSREVRNHLDGATRPYRGGSAGPFRGGKFSCFEGGLRVPGIVRYPDRLDGGRTCDALALTMDLCPTVLSYCDVSVPPGLDGEDLGETLTGRASPHDRVFWAFDGQRAVREGDWKLVVDGVEVPTDATDYRFERVDGPHLANLAADESESRNLAADHPKRTTRLTDAATQWYEAVSAD
jgi:arylsulfatase A-like enzyme